MTEVTTFNFSDTITWGRLESVSELKNAILQVRRTAEIVCAEISRVLPSFTDHSIKHMDALWRISDEIFTKEELSSFSPGEAFVLGCSFYLHDLGMALAATDDGIRQLRESKVYTKAFEQFGRNKKNTPEETCDRIAIQLAARDLHAKNAKGLIENPLPGINQYLLENTELRGLWGNHIGDVAASHHWSLQEVDRKLGRRGRVPDTLGGEVDLGFLACALRLIDYSHINYERASALARAMRTSLDATSIVHWNAQEHITGPRRQDNRLVFGCVRPIATVDAWWLFHEMVSGLNAEIIDVSEYLDARMVSKGRFSLEGVKGIRSPRSFSVFVMPSGFEPVDIRFKSGSMDRVVELLGGSTLYGNDHTAPVRELLQNARDSIVLRRTTDISSDSYCGKVNVTLSDASDGFQRLTVMDNGVGMNSEVVVNYLLGVASDYWNSSHFYSSFSEAKKLGFEAAGKFGIGFLSVFMLGDRVEVKTQQLGGEHLTLTLTGLGQRGELVKRPPRLEVGTSVTIVLSPEIAEKITDLDTLVRLRAPMVDFPIVVSLPSRQADIAPGWWKDVPQEEIFEIVQGWYRLTSNGNEKQLKGFFFLDRSKTSWPVKPPEVIDNFGRVIAIPGKGGVLLCSKGIAVDVIHIKGVVGIIEITDLELDASRSRAIRFDRGAIQQKIQSKLKPKIIETLNSLIGKVNIPALHGFLVDVAMVYGIEVLLESELPWITIVDRIGNATLISANGLSRRLGKQKSVFVCLGASPWSIENIRKRHFPESSQQIFLIPVADTKQASFGSYSEEGIIKSPLLEHFSKTGYHNKFSLNSVGVYLLEGVLRVIASAWALTVEDLINMPWSREKSSYLCGILKKL